MERICTRDHGFPVRVIVPGYVGIRNIKWIEEIILYDEEAQSLGSQD